MSENSIANSHDAPLDVMQVHEFDTLLPRIGSHEGKVAVAALVMSQADVVFRPSDLRHTVTKSQGHQPGWALKHSSLKAYCRTSFVPAGIATEHQDGIYMVVDSRLEQKIAFCGAILQLSLDFPETSVQRMFGSLRSGKDFDSANLKYGVLGAIADNNGFEMAVSDVAYQVKDTFPDEKAVHAAIAALSQQGLLETHKINATRDYKLQIVNPQPYEKGSPPRTRSPLTRLIYEAMGKLCAQGKEIITFDDLRAQALLIDADTDQVALRKHWHRASSSKSGNYPGLKRVERSIKDPHKVSTVYLHSDHAPAIHTALQELGSLTSEPDNVSSHYKGALSIINDPLAMAAIFAKAWRFSPTGAPQQDGLGKIAGRLLAIVQDKGTVDIDSILVALHSIDQPRDRKKVIRHLERLTHEGALTREEKPKDPSSRRAVRFYTAANKDS